MKETNGTYGVVFKGKNVTERYLRDKDGWLKISNQEGSGRCKGNRERSSC